MASAVSIDYWSLVSRSLRIVWRHRVLWFFGFFATAGSGGGFNWVEQGGPKIRDFLLTNPAVLVLIIVGLVILWLVLFIMNVISTGAVVAGVHAASEDREVTFGFAWRQGLKAFWRLLGVSVLALIAFLFVTALCAVPVVLALFGGTSGIVIAIVIGAILLFPYLAFLFLLAFTITYAEREVVLAGAGVFDAISAGWDITRHHIWKSFVVWLVMLGSGIAYGLGLILVLLIVAVPFILIGLANVFVALVLGIPIGIVIVVVASGAFGTYSYSVWTLAYDELKRIDGAPVAASPGAAPPAPPPTAPGAPVPPPAPAGG
jgi:hypothetical protein